MNRGHSISWAGWWTIFAALVVSFSVADAAQPAVRAGATVALTGDLNEAAAYGPPNFGENPATDKKEVYLVLTLSEPIEVRDTDGTALPTASRAQLIVPIEQPTLTRKLKQLVGAGAVRITGKVFPATTGHHHEAVVLIVESAEKLGQN